MPVYLQGGMVLLDSGLVAIDTGCCCGGGGGACCITGVCSIQSDETTCIGLGGHYFGDGTDCDPDPCPLIGCCLSAPRNCDTMVEADCIAIGGTFTTAGTYCWPEGDGGAFGQVSCCTDTDVPCTYFTDQPNFNCCPQDYTCCFDSCCAPTETCCGEFGPCCSEFQTCTEFGCV